MTYPTKPSTAYSFTDYQAANPTDPLPGNELDADLAEHKASIDATIDFLKIPLRSDGRLQNGFVRPENLSSGTLALITAGGTFIGAWLTATAYVVQDIVTESSRTYVALIAHTSGTFATDLAAGKWIEIDGNDASLDGNNVFTGTNEFDGVVNFDAAVDLGALATATTPALNDATTKVATMAALDVVALKNLVIRYQFVSVSGDYTPHANMITVDAMGVGGGGGGGGAPVPATAGHGGGGGGGGGGEYAMKTFTKAEIGASKPVVIGAAGTGGAAGANAGTAGGNTTLGGTLLIATGGGLGAAGSATASTMTAGGLGGTGGTGDVLIPGGAGGNGVNFTDIQVSNVGGSSHLGAGGRPSATFVGGAGGAGVGKGAGGAGGRSVSGQAAAAGGNGAIGYMIFKEYCTS